MDKISDTQILAIVILPTPVQDIQHSTPSSLDVQWTVFKNSGGVGKLLTRSILLEGREKEKVLQKKTYG